MSEPFWAEEPVTLYLGDCLDVLADMPANSVDAVVCDPPYNLSDGGKRDADCLRRILSEFTLPGDGKWDAESGQGGNLPGPSLGGSALRRVHGAAGIDARVRVPERAVDLQRAATTEQEVDAGGEAASFPPDCGLAAIGDAERVQGLRRYVLQPTDGSDAPFCDGTCSCFTEPRAGAIAVAVALPGPAGCDLAGGDLGGARWGGQDIGRDDDARGQAEGAPAVLAERRAVAGAMLRLDLGRRTGELFAAGTALQSDPLFALLPAPEVGAGAGTGGFPAELEAARISLIGAPAGGAIALHLPWHSLNPTRQAVGFMGKAWDGWESPAAFQRWCTAWARECLRILKPGGHLLAFGGTRTWHRLTCAIEDAGFEIRDSLHWIYGSGFPKSLNVSKAIDKAAGAQREVVGKSARHGGGTNNVYAQDAWTQANQATMGALTAPATDAAKQWDGWGTALKPAHEPVVLAQKPFNPVSCDWWLVANVHHALAGLLWLALSPAKRAELSSPSGNHAPGGAWCASARVSAALGTSPGASAETATFSSQALASTSWSIAGSWSAILAALSDPMRTSTTSTASSTTTALRTLNSLLAPITSQTTMPPCGCLLDGGSSTAPSADGSLSAGWQNWLNTLSRSVPATATEGIALAASSALASIAADLLNGLEAGSSAPPNATPSIGGSTGDGIPSPTVAWGDAPAHEPIILARKPLAGTVVGNVLAHGTGALNVDGCSTDTGRWPPNVILTHAPACNGECAPGCPVAELDSQSGRLTSGNVRPEGFQGEYRAQVYGRYARNEIRPETVYADSGGASRFFPALAWEDGDFAPFRYQAKAPKSERPVIEIDGKKHIHPTVKPVALMRWLIRLVTPPGGTVLDLFAGTGTTAEACIVEGFPCVLIDKDPVAAALIRERLRKPIQPDLFGGAA